jgi:alanine-alpha-ketoisovalerate/valine-pyruvate aminotransferase
MKVIRITNQGEVSIVSDTFEMNGESTSSCFTAEFTALFDERIALLLSLGITQEHYEDTGFVTFSHKNKPTGEVLRDDENITLHFFDRVFEAIQDGTITH